MSKCTPLDFSNQHFYIGIDVHKKRWVVTIRKKRMVMKRFKLQADPAVLYGHLVKNYPGGIYHSVYEAGFCGFWIHRDLISLGINNMVVNAADVPTSHKERDRKRDKVDSGKLARELENGSLDAIYVPDYHDQQIRSLVRLRRSQIKQMTRLKNRIKSFLHYNGIELPPHSQTAHWSNAFVEYLSELSFPSTAANDCLALNLKALKQQRELLADTLKRLRTYSRQQIRCNLIHRCLLSVPGIGFISAMTLYSEIIDMNRFASLDHLKSFAGLVPSIASSDEKTVQKGLTFRRNPHVKHVIIEAAWIAVRKDPAMTMTFNKLCERMPKQQAIIRIAKKLLNRLRYVWIHQTTYQAGVIQ